MYRVLYLAAIGIFLAAPVPSEAGGAPSASRLSRLRGHVGTEQRDIPQQQASVQVSGVANATAAEISPTGVGGLLRPRDDDRNPAFPAARHDQFFTSTYTGLSFRTNDTAPPFTGMFLFEKAA